jgi:3-hydroxyacyl-[acyl-carrier-protein] dehydratase
LDPARWLPHGKEFLFIDEVLSVDDRRASATRIVPEIEPWTSAHFPGEPLVPGVLLLEGMVQTAGVLARRGGQREAKVNGRLASIRSARFIQPVRPGSRLIYRAELKSRVGTLYLFDASVEIEGGAVAATASIVLSISDQGEVRKVSGECLA